MASFFLPTDPMLQMQLKELSNLELLDAWEHALLMDDLAQMESTLSKSISSTMNEHTVVRELSLRAALNDSLFFQRAPKADSSENQKS